MVQAAQRIAVFGATGSGKTAWTKQHLARIKPRRLLVWDFKHDPALDGLGEPFTELPALIDAARSKTFSLRYLVNHGADFHAQFDVFCRVAWELGDLWLFVDELPEVTKANKAPPAWRRLVNVGRQYQAGGRVKWISIIGAGQRPAECDKSFIGNADVVHTGRLGDATEAKKIAAAWGLGQRDLIDLPNLHWLEKRADSSEIHRGVLSFSNTEKRGAGRPKA